MTDLIKIKEYNKKLLQVEKGNTLNLKNKTKAQFKIGLGFASEYKYAIHTIGFQYIYFKINEYEDFFCQRFYYPDLIDLHKRSKIPVLTQETNSPINKMELLLFSLNYEGNYLKLLDLLNLSGIQLNKAKRGFPILIAGGICPTYNPEPLKNIFDAFVIGEAEDVLPKILKAYKNKLKKHDFLKKISSVQGVYVPGYNTKVKKAQTASLNTNLTSHITTPFSKFPNTLFLEIQRGCQHNCKFCILSHSFKEARMRSINKILKIAKKQISFCKNIRLISPSSCDHPNAKKIYEKVKELGFSIKSGSQRADRLIQKKDILKFVKNDKLTIAPETASANLRNKINKQITNKQIYDCVRLAAKNKYKTIQFFFIIGFSNETSKDRQEIIKMVKKTREILDSNNSEKTTIELTINCHIKKPHTDFERDAQLKVDKYLIHINKIKSALKKIKIDYMDETLLLLEAILVRGSEKEGMLLEKIYSALGINPKRKDIENLINTDKYFTKIRGKLPWSFINLRPSKKTK